MKYLSFYQKTEQRLTDAIMSLWATGDKEMQDYFRFLLEQDPIVADPIFQNTFPWENGTLKFRETTNLFQPEFINALDSIKDKDYRFPHSRRPYKHQLASWKTLLKDKKSIAVTTGTGSGKTECFMLPVLQDIHENCKNQEGINAIFLYPLNALIASQRKRMHAWCSALDGIRYALLTGDTNDTRNRKDKEKALPELISREQIRNSPPQILFTNPTMLEYMLVRRADSSILEKSKGKLRWILLDEAHTLTGSKAAETALLIRRVVCAFGVKIENLRFAITSATVGSGNSDVLKKFMSKLCGISTNQIEVIHGKRVNKNISDTDIPSFSTILSKEKIIALRKKMLTTKCLNQQEIGRVLGIKNKKEQLDSIDFLSEQKINEDNLLPTRGHFFTRGIGGVYVCTNVKCEEHKDKRPDKAIGTMYTIAGKECNCGHPLLELIACRSCGNMMMEGEVVKNSNNKHIVRQLTSTGYEAFNVENNDIDDEDDGSIRDNLVRRFIKNNPNQKLSRQDLTSCSISKDYELLEDGNDFLQVEDSRCPHCGNLDNRPIHFRISSAFTNRILSDIVLDQTADKTDKTDKTLYQGKKYISFTDSRQGTAKISALINIDSERNWIRYQTYHYLLKEYKENQEDFNHEELITRRAIYVEQLQSLPPFMKKEYEEKIAEIDKLLEQKGSPSLKKSRSTWSEITNKIKSKVAFTTLFKKGARGQNIINQSDAYAKALLYDQFARRLQRERSLENLGLVNIIYPELDKLALPEIAKKLNITLEEWKDLLKIAMDYIVRNGFHFSFPNEVGVFTTKYYRPSLIYPSSSEVANAKKWPSYNSHSTRQSRFVLLLCAGLGWHSPEDMTEDNQDLLNEFLEKMWRTLKSKLLEPDGEQGGFKLDFFKKTQLEIAGKEYLCPISNRLLDNVFRGYSPWIKGSLSIENLSYYKIDESKTHQFDTFSHPYHLNKENSKIENKTVEIWLDENRKDARNKGLWNNLYEKVFGFEKLYLAGEHSAQQNKTRLSELEKQFEEGELNILSCSTTMEMGVDIGGISAVVMSNVPPMPANYLQRAGRAGRRSENKSLALTFCAPNPIGLRTMNNPKWALEHPIAPPTLTFDSKSIIERHLNSLLFGIFIRQLESLNIKENIERFFFSGTPDTIAEKFLKWLEECNHSDYGNDLRYLTKDTLMQEYSIVQFFQNVSDNFNQIVQKVRNQIKSYEEKLQELATRFGDNTPAFKAVDRRRMRLNQKFVLNYLAEENFLPNAGLPTGIVDFEKTNVSDIKKHKSVKSSQNPSYPIVRALTEFAPGNNILIDGLNYKSAGVLMKNTYGQEGSRQVVQGCKKCGYQRILKTKENPKDRCPKCDGGYLTGIEMGEHNSQFTEIIEPIGFAIDLFSTPKRAISEKIKPQHLQPLLLNIDPYHPNQNGYLDFRTSEGEEDAQILFYNLGEGAGYSLCLDCGKVEILHDKLIGHKRLRGGKDSNGESVCTAKNIKDNIILGSRFKTDFTEIRLKNPDGSFLNNNKIIYTLGVIITKSLAEYLAIEESELGFGTKQYRGYQTIFIYDTAKGGAGYASRLTIYITEVLNLAKKALKCSCTTACTRCLIDRSSQWHIEKLDRHLALEWLDSALQQKLPKELESKVEKVGFIFGSLLDEIRSQDYNNGIKSINIHINSNISEWEIDDLQWLDYLKRNHIEINLIIEGEIRYSNNQEKLSIHLLSNKYNLKKGTKKLFMNHSIMLSMELQNGEKLGYVSKGDYPILNALWIKSAKEKIYRVEDMQTSIYTDLKMPNFDKINLFESRVQSIPHGSTSNDLAKLLFENISNPEDLMSRIQNESYKVIYYDKYNQSEFSMHLMLQFVYAIQDICSIKVEKLDIHLTRSAFDGNRFPSYIIHNYECIDDYKNDLEVHKDYCNFEAEIIRKDKLPHYRCFEFISDNVSFILRIDGGIAHGFKPKEYLRHEHLLHNNQIFAIRKDVSHDIIYNITLTE